MTRSLILLAHESPDSRHADTVDTIAERVSRELGPAWTVSTSYLQHHGPTVTDAFGAARHSDNLTVAIQPLLLTAGEHWRTDVPEFTKDVLSHSAVQLLRPPTPRELLSAVLETLSPIEPRGREPEPARDTSMPKYAAMPHRNVLLAAGGSRIQDLHRHFESLAIEVERSLGHGVPQPKDMQTRSASVGILSRPAEIRHARSSGPSTQIVPLLVSTGRVYDSMVEAADQVGARVASPVGETSAFARMLAERATTHLG